MGQRTVSRPKARGQALSCFLPLHRIVTVFPSWFTVSHSQAAEAKGYVNEPLTRFINDCLLQGTVLSTMERTQKTGLAPCPGAYNLVGETRRTYRERQVTVQDSARTRANSTRD